MWKSSAAEPITTTKFKSIMEENGLEVTDKTDSAKDRSYQEIYIAIDEEKYSFEYYVMKNEKSAANVYKYAVDNLNKTYKENNSAKITENENNIQSVFDVTASDYYCKVIKKDNTVLYITAYSKYKKKCRKAYKGIRILDIKKHGSYAIHLRYLPCFFNMLYHSSCNHDKMNAFLYLNIHIRVAFKNVNQKKPI